ncbi:MAG TPA: Rid family hydrolase [Sphingopyxis sp.]|uniref:Rid family hydrolase n=1 Tax=Sphingopyxis sp. TaxID=1908224 RepID=UPI002C0AB0B8|nr:Rid family hydrolase [Sphingopyxis sp.]HWW57060.1 Rid family hydrolase [Sphingopyxis sp.]
MTTTGFLSRMRSQYRSAWYLLGVYTFALAALTAGARADARPAPNAGGTHGDSEVAGAGESAPASASSEFPRYLPVAGGEVILPTSGAQRAHDLYRFAAARRSGNILYLSGVIIGRGPGVGRDVEQFKSQVRRAFVHLETTLAAGCATFGDVVKVTSFHVWDSPDFSGGRDAQFAAFSEVLGEFIAPPYPAWTAVGTTGLLAEGGIVEVELVAHLAPGDRACSPA